MEAAKAVRVEMEAEAEAARVEEAAEKKKAEKKAAEAAAASTKDEGATSCPRTLVICSLQ